MTCLKSSKRSLVGLESKLTFLLVNAGGIVNWVKDCCGAHNLIN